MINVDDRLLDLVEGQELKLLMKLEQLSDENRQCWYSVEQLADKCKWKDARTVRLHLKRLAKKKLIKIKSRPQKTNIYTVTTKMIGKFLGVHDVSVPTQSVLTEDVFWGVHDMSDNHIKQDHIKQLDAQTHQSQSREDYLFEDFWNDYDLKKDKARCQSKWKKLPLKEKIKIKKRLPQYLAQTTPDRSDRNNSKTFRKNPLTFLNQKTWEDYEDEPVKQEQPKPAESTPYVQKRVVVERTPKGPVDPNAIAKVRQIMKKWEKEDQERGGKLPWEEMFAKRKAL